MFLIEEKDFYNFPELITVKNQAANLKSLWTNSRLDLTVKVLRSVDSNSNLFAEDSSSAFGSFHVARKIGFSSVVAPGVIR